MGRVIPKGKAERLAFLRSHVPQWIANAAELGLDAATVASLSATLTAAEDAYSNQIAKQFQARAATVTCDNAIDRATRLASTVVMRIKSVAQAEESLEPYALGQIPPPKAPVRSAQPPTQPQIVSLTMELGMLEIKWSGSLSNTDFFTIYRIGADRTRVHLASLRGLSYRDASVPLDEGDVSYCVVANRRGIEATSSTVAFLTPRQLSKAA